MIEDRPLITKVLVTAKVIQKNSSSITVKYDDIVTTFSSTKLVDQYNVNDMFKLYLVSKHDNNNNKINYLELTYRQ